MQSHNTGAITGSRQGSVVVQQSFRLDFATNASGTDLLLCTICASATRPVKLRLAAVVGTSYDAATSAVLSVGTAAAGTQLLNAVNIKAAAGTKYTPTITEQIYVVDTPIYARTTSVGTNTVGQVFIMAEIAELNVNQPTVTGE